MTNINRAARDIAGAINRDIANDPDWVPTSEQVMNRIDDYCDDPDTTSGERAAILFTLLPMLDC